jgi:hypothetical protein
MSYVDSHLMPAEKTLYRAHLHRIVYVWAALFALFFLVIAFAAKQSPAVFVLLAVASVTPAAVTVRTSAFAVTNAPSWTWLASAAFDRNAIGQDRDIRVDQDIVGRMLGYGSIVVAGTGGDKEPFKTIADPMELRKQIQMATPRKTATLSEGSLLGRDERDCPYCTERILAKARVCKHCGREVTPVTTWRCAQGHVTLLMFAAIVLVPK